MRIFNLFRRDRHELTSLYNLTLEQEKLITEASIFIKEIEKGNLSIGISDTFKEHELGKSLSSMQNHLSKLATEEEARNWMNIGLAKFSDILRNKQSLPLQELSDSILMNLVKYINANQGAIYILEDSIKDDVHLSTLACYAYNRKKYLSKRIEIGEGLVGQCILEREAIFITEIPDGYINITSGLGGATPNCILISPLLINDTIFGAIELASFDVLDTYKIDFINKLSENIASTIKNVKDNQRTLELLNASQQQAEELRAQEEEMRQNLEEMQATQEEMARKNEEIARAAAESKSVLNGINATMATIEFIPDGTVITANINFLQTMQYTLNDIEGKHHQKFVPQEIIESAEYKTFWKKLASGVAHSGVFKRINSRGETVWLNAIYNPILGPNGEVIKVTKFATDITKEQEVMAENKGILDGIDATMATIEFSPDGTILKANSNFLSLMQYSLSEIKGKHHRIFISEETHTSEEYKTFWTKLAAGTSTSGIFRRINAQGETVELNAIYNPILNASGNVYKVIKFATSVIPTAVEFSHRQNSMSGF